MFRSGFFPVDHHIHTLPAKMAVKTLGKNNFWTFTAEDGFDLTHPPFLGYPSTGPRIQLATTKNPVTIDPTKTALVIIDMQNYFLSSALRRSSDHPGMIAVDRLVNFIPLCRRAGIRIVWLSWGLTVEDIECMPPSIARAFDFGPDPNLDAHTRYIGGLGSDIGEVKHDNGDSFQAGRVLCNGEWNTRLYHRLDRLSHPLDIYIKKNRPSGFWDAAGPERVLHSTGIRTLMFAGGSTDQSLSGSMQGASMQGWDCLMLSDACAAMAPELLTTATKLHCESEWGFVSTCQQFVDGIYYPPTR